MKSVKTGVQYNTECFNFDKNVNNSGKKLISVCQSFGLEIVNGRFDYDKFTGNYTCFSSNGSSSTIDYATVSDQFMDAIENLKLVNLRNACLMCMVQCCCIYVALL